MAAMETIRMPVTFPVLIGAAIKFISPVRDEAGVLLESSKHPGREEMLTNLLEREPEMAGNNSLSLTAPAPQFDRSPQDEKLETP
ncbi:hypothetical protein RRG08_062721 [Elysia crispata]|uniref:Uncharacterized protein n=1 Tax=Elysia crispata TaxID=231223 RepID=A0AAE1ADC3_9GAST|nr:hypothetical protein RRG08_062721 [Elysia crispata]